MRFPPFGLTEYLKAGYIEGFGHNVDVGKWRLTTDPLRPLEVMPSGGNPGAFLYGQVSTAVPTWYVPSGVSSPFIGDYFARGVLALSVDLTRQHGWCRYTYAVESTSSTIPKGWVLTRGDGTAGTDADWPLLMQDVETLGFEMGIPGYGYPDLNIWTLGIDNAAILAGEGE